MFVSCRGNCVEDESLLSSINRKLKQQGLARLHEQGVSNNDETDMCQKWWKAVGLTIQGLEEICQNEGATPSNRQTALLGDALSDDQIALLGDAFFTMPKDAEGSVVYLQDEATQTMVLQCVLRAVNQEINRVLWCVKWASNAFALRDVEGLEPLPEMLNVRLRNLQGFKEKVGDALREVCDVSIQKTPNYRVKVGVYSAPEEAVTILQHLQMYKELRDYECSLALCLRYNWDEYIASKKGHLSKVDVEHNKDAAWVNVRALIWDVKKMGFCADRLLRRTGPAE